MSLPPSPTTKESSCRTDPSFTVSSKKPFLIKINWQIWIRRRWIKQRNPGWSAWIDTVVVGIDGVLEVVLEV